MTQDEKWNQRYQEVVNFRDRGDRYLFHGITKSVIKEKTGVTNSTAFQQLPADMKKSVLIELKGKRASLRQLERLTGISKSMIYRM